MAVVGGILTGIFYSFGGFSLYIANANDQQTKTVVALPSSTLAEAVLVAPTRNAKKFPFVKAAEEVIENSTIKITEKWREKSSGRWETYLEEVVISKIRTPQLALVDDTKEQAATKVLVPFDKVEDELFELVDEQVDQAPPPDPKVNFSLSLGLSSEGGTVIGARVGNDRQPRFVGMKKLRKVLRADTKMFAAGVVVRGKADGSFELQESPKDRLFALAVGAESDYLDLQKTNSSVFTKIGYACLGFGTIALGFTCLVVWATTISERRRPSSYYQ
eukprot:TRINITY_DN6330_c0_g1_i1.p1 TRINITY_DN6330_c0_g1~~TRINITY_DN6330_c0_g1_i1.p1  ORF type:complete len:289 (-),score=65.12 TRINITY_DN6330_c0_g1_i1:34-858(-)